MASRVAKQIRELNERLPAIREQNARRCRRNHPMVIRGGPHGQFWGCSRYPHCQETAQFTPEETDFLARLPHGLSGA